MDTKQVMVFVAAPNSEGCVELLAYRLEVTPEAYDDGVHYARSPREG